MIGSLKQQFDGLKRDGSDDQPCSPCVDQLKCDHTEIVIDVTEPGKDGRYARECADCGSVTGGVEAPEVPTEAIDEDGTVPLEAVEQ